MLEHGLAAALDSLAARATVPTKVTSRRHSASPEPVELAAYFVASEALANVAKYAHATTVSMRVWRTGHVASIEIADNGVGGANDAAARGCAASPIASRRWRAACASQPRPRGDGGHRGAAVRGVTAAAQASNSTTAYVWRLVTISWPPGM